jgi:hypothetical protein
MHAHLNDPKDQPFSQINEPHDHVEKVSSLPSLCLICERDGVLDRSDCPLKRANNAHCLKTLRDNLHNHVALQSKTCRRHCWGVLGPSCNYTKAVYPIRSRLSC